MKFAEFIKILKADGEKLPGSVFLIEGEDAYFRASALSALKNRISEPELNFVQFDGASADIKDILSSLYAYPFMSEFRLTAIYEFYPDKNQLKGEFQKYLDNPPYGGLLAVVNEKVSDSLKRFSSVVTVDCGKADKDYVIKRITDECAASCVVIERNAAERIAEYCLFDMCRIKNETLKLITYAGEGNIITEEDVDRLVPRDTEYKIYEMTDCIAKKKFDKAVFIVNDMISRGETPQRILISIYNYFRRLLHVSISAAGREKLAWLLGIKEFAVKKAIEQSGLFKKRSLKKTVDFLEETDYKLKVGAAEPDSAMWLAVFKIMTE